MRSPYNISSNKKCQKLLFYKGLRHFCFLKLLKTGLYQILYKIKREEKKYRNIDIKSILLSNVFTLTLHDHRIRNF